MVIHYIIAVTGNVDTVFVGSPVMSVEMASTVHHGIADVQVLTSVYAAQIREVTTFLMVLSNDGNENSFICVLFS